METVLFDGNGVISREQVLKILVNGAIDNLPNGNRERIH